MTENAEDVVDCYDSEDKRIEVQDELACLERLLEFKKQSGNSKEELELLGKIANILVQKGELLKLERYISLIQRKIENLKNDKFKAKMCLRLGRLYQEIERYDKALYYYREAEKLLASFNPRDSEANNLLINIKNNKAVIFLFHGNVDEAIRQLESVVSIYENSTIKTIRETKIYISALANLGNIYHELNNSSKALYYFEKAKDKLSDLLISNKDVIGRKVAFGVYINLSHLYVHEKKLESAKRLLKLARRNFPPNDKLSKIHYLIVLSKLWSEFGNYENSVKILQKAQELGRNIKHEYVEGLILTELGIFYKNIGDYQKALINLIEARKFFQKIKFYKARVKSTIDEIEGNFIKIASQWGARVELKDPYTLGHSARTTYYAFLIGKKLMDDELSLKGLLIGGFLHDIGKLKIDDKILLKRGKLTPEERKEIEKHPVYAIEQLKNIEFPWKNVKDCILFHHEKYDGTGYPEGLKGEQIPLCARIIAVADVFDALTTDRPYRSALSWQQALRFIQENKGKYFDPVVVDTFAEILEKLDKSLISTQHTKHMVEELWRFFA